MNIGLAGGLLICFIDPNCTSTGVKLPKIVKSLKIEELSVI